MEIRKAKKEDCEEIINLINQFKKEIKEPMLNAEHAEKIIYAINNNLIVFYIVLESEIVGMCSLSSCFSTYKAKLISILDDVYIVPDKRKKGYLRKLINFAKEDSKEKDICSIMLGCSDSDVEMYKSLGFVNKLGNMLAMDV